MSDERLLTKNHTDTIMHTRNSVARPSESGGRTTLTKWPHTRESIENDTARLLTKHPADTIESTKNKYARPGISGWRTIQIR